MMFSASKTLFQGWLYMPTANRHYTPGISGTPRLKRVPGNQGVGAAWIPRRLNPRGWIPGSSTPTFADPKTWPGFFLSVRY